MKKFIKVYLLANAFWFLLVSFIDSLVSLTEKGSPTSNRFNYLFLYLFCFAMYAIIETIEENKPK